MPYTAEHKRRTRNRIVEAARRMFNAHGYNGVGIDRIMAEAGLTRGGFYAHFKGKEDLFAEVVQWIGPSKELQKKYFAENDASGDKVLDFIRAYLSRVHLDNLAESCPLAALSLDISRAGPVVRHSYTQAFQTAAQRFSRYFSDQNLDTEALAYLLLTNCVGGMVLARAVDDEGIADTILNACQESVIQLAGVRPQE